MITCGAASKAKAEYRTEKNDCVKDKRVSRVTVHAIMQAPAGMYCPTLEENILTGLPLFARHAVNGKPSGRFETHDRFSNIADAFESIGD